MAPLPKRKHSTRRKGKRRAAIHFKLPALIACPSCGQLKKSHQACPSCGSYRDIVVANPKTKKKKEK